MLTGGSGCAVHNTRCTTAFRCVLSLDLVAVQGWLWYVWDRRSTWLKELLLLSLWRHQLWSVHVEPVELSV